MKFYRFAPGPAGFDPVRPGGAGLNGRPVAGTGFGTGGDRFRCSRAGNRPKTAIPRPGQQRAPAERRVRAPLCLRRGTALLRLAAGEQAISGHEQLFRRGPGVGSTNAQRPQALLPGPADQVARAAVEAGAPNSSRSPGPAANATRLLT